ncbi:MAG: hypothetical protein ACODAJ_00165, partial [Planctomycetota bacterium]
PMLGVEVRKTASGKFQTAVSAKIRCRPDALATPTGWRVTFRTLGPDKKPFPGTRIEKTATVANGRIEIRDGTTSRSLSAPEAFTVHWALFDAVQRLPRGAFEPKAFTLLDNFDEPKPHHTLSYRKSVELLLGGRRVQRHRWQELEKGRIRKTVWVREGDRPVPLHAYDHLGDGIVPEVYFVDAQGRLLIVAAGLEAYIWEGAS